jgi:hypothetical protein
VAESELHITIESSPASDSWGFVGRVMIADHECYRTLRAYPTPTEALRAAQVIVGDVLGALLAGQEWRSMSEQLGHPPTRADLGLGLGAYRRGGDGGGHRAMRAETDGAPSERT